MNTQAYQKYQKSFAKFIEDYNKELLEKLSELSPEAKQQVEDVLSTMVVKAETSKSSVPKKKRAPTEYNLFMKDKIKELREAHPDIDKTELMRMGAKEWQKLKAEKTEKEKKNLKKK